MRFRRMLLLYVLLLVSSFAGTASATTVTVSPGGATTMTGGAVEITDGTQTISCPGMTATATLVSGSTTLSTNMAPAFTSCTMTPVRLRVTISCSSASLLRVTGLTIGGVTYGVLTGLSCTASLNATCSVRITGSVLASFDNATSVLTIYKGSQSLTGTGSTCSFFANGTIGMTGPGFGNLQMTVTPGQTVTVV